VPSPGEVDNAVYEIDPFHPPLPTASSFPFQFCEGSQTSILISESLEGFSVAVTRQNAGKSLSGIGVPRAPAGGVNSPAAIVFADVIVVLGSLSPPRLSHVAAADAGVTLRTRTNKTAQDKTILLILGYLD
jgi:hypothetical protein